jgi:hypothetical protein
MTSTFTQAQLEAALATLIGKGQTQSKPNNPNELKRFKKKNPRPSEACSNIGVALARDCRWSKGAGPERDKYCAMLGNSLRKCDFTTGAPHINNREVPDFYNKDPFGYQTRDPVRGYTVYDPTAAQPWDGPYQNVPIDQMFDPAKKMYVDASGGTMSITAYDQQMQQRRRQQQQQQQQQPTPNQQQSMMI